MSTRMEEQCERRQVIVVGREWLIKFAQRNAATAAASLIGLLPAKEIAAGARRRLLNVPVTIVDGDNKTYETRVTIKRYSPISTAISKACKQLNLKYEVSRKKHWQANPGKSHYGGRRHIPGRRLIELNGWRDYDQRQLGSKSEWNSYWMIMQGPDTISPDEFIHDAERLLRGNKAGYNTSLLELVLTPDGESLTNPQLYAVLSFPDGPYM